jgi:hypothetical protein
VYQRRSRMEMADIVVGINKCDFLGGKVAQGWQ